MLKQILITGARGKTGRRLARHLQNQGVSIRLGTRKTTGPNDVYFDWSQPDCFKDAFDGCAAAYLVAPTDRADHLEVMTPGIEKALRAGVRRFVLLSASSLEPGGPMMGGVHAMMRDCAPEWCVLRPTWFMQNFSEQQHLTTIRDENTIYTATGLGRVPFIDADDIAASAAAALTIGAAPNSDIILTGPQLLNYDEVAQKFSERLRRSIRHVNLSRDDLAARLRKMGFDDSYANALADMDHAISQGSEERVTNGVQSLTGRSALSFDSFIDANLAVWR